MGYRGKLTERQQARELRVQAWTLADIAAELGVSKASVSVWVRDVEFEPLPRRTGRRREPNALQRRKAAEIEEGRQWGRDMIGHLTERDFLVAGAMLYAGEGSKTQGAVRLANSDPRMIALFCRWLRRFFDVDESRLRVRLYLHEGLDLVAAVEHWAGVTGVPSSQFSAPYRAVADSTRRFSKHRFGCATVIYSCSHTHRRILGLVDALLSCGPHIPG